MTPSTADILGPVIAVWAVTMVIGAGVYVWYALMLSRLFPRLGADGWKGWVPILNEAEILRLGGVPAWSVVLYFLPLVNLYGLYLKIVATSRINAHFGKGAGLTVLAILLPPIWVTLLVVGSRPVDPALQERIAPSIPERSGYAFAVTTPAADAHSAAPGVPPVPGVPPAAPPSAPAAAPAPPPPPPFGAPPPPPLPAASHASAPPPLVAPPAPPAPVTSFPPPPAPAPEAAPAHIVPPPGLLLPPPPAPAAPLAPPPPAPASPAAAPPTPAPSPVAAPAPSWSPLAAPAAPPAPVAPAPPAGEEAGDELDRTVVVDRRPRIPWVLRVEDGADYPLAGSSVVLGRQPTATAGAQVIAVPDPTRTLSKVHARLDLADGVWTVTDLNATNGVIVVAADGSEELLDPGASAAVVERFVLGKVGMRIALDDATAG